MTTFTTGLNNAYANGKGSLNISANSTVVSIASLANVALTMDNVYVYATDLSVSNSVVVTNTATFSNTVTVNGLFTANGITVAAGATLTTPNTYNTGSVNSSANGFCYLPGGLILNWGTANCNSSVGTITYQQPFITNAYAIMLTPNSGVYDYVQSQNSSVANVRTSLATTATPVQFMAIGI